MGLNQCVFTIVVCIVFKTGHGNENAVSSVTQHSHNIVFGVVT